MRSEAAWTVLFVATLGAVAAAPVDTSLDSVRSGEMLRKVDGGYEPLPLLAMDVDLEITGTLVHGEVTQRFSNPTGGVVDALYVFPLPERAAVDGMEIRIGDRRIVAVVKEREEAKAAYEAARREGKKAGLVEQQRPNLFQTSVANVDPGGIVEVRLSYLEEVTWQDGELGLVFPLTFTPRYTPEPHEPACCAPGAFPATAVPARTAGTSVPQARIEVRFDRGSPIEQVRSSSHEIDTRSDEKGTTIAPRGGTIVADRDFVLTWKIRRGWAPAATAYVEDREDGRYALVMVVPPAPGTKDELGWPTDTVFVVDVSGSMAGTSIEAAKKTVALALDRLRPGDHFDVVAFDDGLYPMNRALQPLGTASLSEGHAFVRALAPRGGTEIVPALLHAIDELRTARGSRQQRLILVTDGAVGNEEEAFREVASRLGDARLHVVGIGGAPNRYLMRKLAEIGRGSCTFVVDDADLAASLDSFFRKIDRPVLTDVTVDVEGGGSIDRYPARLPDLYAGDPILVSLRLGPASGATRIRLGGRTVEGTLRTDVSLGSDAAPGSGVAARFARRKIESLIDSLREGGDPDDVRARVIEVATEFHLASPYTSLVAVEEVPSVTGPSTQMRIPHALPAGMLPQTGTDGPLVLAAGLLLATLGGNPVLGLAHVVGPGVSRRRALVAAAMALLSAGSLALGRSAYMGAKGVAAGVLVDRALAAHLADGAIHRPWSWADTWPIARIEIEATGLRRTVLSGATGGSLPFGLGHLEGTALPGARGNCVVAGHRDTWAAFVRGMKPGDAVRVRTHRGVTEYRVTSTRVARESDPEVGADADRPRLTLVTCYPFSGILRSPLRYVVTCDALG